jgi:hypothetical protein
MIAVAVLVVALVALCVGVSSVRYQRGAQFGLEKIKDGARGPA